MYYIGIDVGSASARTGVYDATGTRLAFATRAIKQFHPKANFVEQSSDNIWSMICEATKEAVEKAGIDATKVRSIGFDATCSLVALDKKRLLHFGLRKWRSRARHHHVDGPPL